ncbi:MAG: hypothetical protein KAT69_10715 [Candidatus Aminicenantes bacterium]|nr:hypothetical protein [Candidatus Aminicenantes bacterium]
MKKKLIFGFIFLLLAFGFLEAQYHFFLRSNRFWSNAGVFSTDGRIQSIGSNNTLRAAYSPSVYADLICDSGGNLEYSAPIDFSNMTASSTLWTLFNGIVSSDTAVKGIYLEITSTKTSSQTEGIRAEGIGNAASGTATIRGGHFKANILAGKKATMLEGVLAHASVAEGTITGLTNLKGLSAFVSSGAGLNVTNLYGATIHVQTRGDETVGTNDVVLQVQNEAVGGNGRQMDSFIQLVGTNLTGGIKGATYLIDAGTVTDLVGTAFMRLGDDEVMASVDHADKLNDISSTANDGWIKVVIAGETKYIALYDEKTS